MFTSHSKNQRVTHFLACATDCGVAQAFDDGKTVDLRGWDKLCVRVPRTEKDVTFAEYYELGYRSVVYVEKEAGGKTHRVLLSIDRAPERMPSHGAAVHQWGEAVIPKSLVAKHSARFPDCFHMDYSARAGATFYQTLFGQSPRGACAAVHVTARGFLGKPTPQQRQPREPQQSRLPASKVSAPKAMGITAAAGRTGRATTASSAGSAARQNTVDARRRDSQAAAPAAASAEVSAAAAAAATTAAAAADTVPADI
eukprot:scaffold129247_cov51-Phaeocystis_antarctica.AAC.1